MAIQNYKYIIVGGGLAGAAAVAGIRDEDAVGSVLLIGNEHYLPYDRPPLSKKLWFGKKTVEEVFVYDEEFYREMHVDVLTGTRVVDLDAESRVVTDSPGNIYQYDKLLLATGGVPRKLDIPGGDLPGVCYFRYLDDYLRIRPGAKEGRSAVVIGGGFIGSELAAALNISNVEVTMVFPEPYLVSRVFPEGLGRAIQDRYIRRGVRIFNEDIPTVIENQNGRFLTHTGKGQLLESDMVIVGIGITPAVELAERAGLKIDNGIVVNEFLQSSDPDIYAAGDNANFPHQILGKRMRIEHWDNALSQGRHAGRNMAGAGLVHSYMPYFFSDLFDFGYEAVGEVDSRLDVVEDWQKEFDTGTIYYLRDGKVRGVMLCNIWEKLNLAREMIRLGKTIKPIELTGAIR